MATTRDIAPAMPSAVAAVFDTFPAGARDRLLNIRDLIYDTAASDPRIGPLTETLKWGEPAYLTGVTKSGTTIRLGWKPKAPDKVALYINCRTSLLSQWRDLYTGTLRFDGNRAILFDARKPLPGDPLRHCIAMALTYHLKD